MNDKANAIDFLNNPRGKYIVGQALYHAIAAMKAAPAPHKEASNIADMEYLMKNLFPMYAAINGPEVEAAMIEKMAKTKLPTLDEVNKNELLPPGHGTWSSWGTDHI